MTALPPLPAPKIAYGYVWKVPIAKHDYYTAEQVEAIRRETVEACARVCELEAKHNADMAPGSYGMYDHMEQAALDCAGEIRALLEKQP